MGNGGSNHETTLLVVGTEDPALAALAASLSAAGHRVVRARTGAEAFGVLAGQSVDAVVCAARLADMDGARLLAQAARPGVDVPGLLILDPVHRWRNYLSYVGKIRGFGIPPMHSNCIKFQNAC